MYVYTCVYYVYIYMYISIYICLHIHVYAYIILYVCLNTCSYIYMYSYAYIYIYTCIHILYTYKDFCFQGVGIQNSYFSMFSKQNWNSSRLLILNRTHGTMHVRLIVWSLLSSYCNTLQHTATQYNTLHYTATHCSILQRIEAHCRHFSSRHCKILQKAATLSDRSPPAYLRESFSVLESLQHSATHCNTLQHSATHCNIWQHTAAHCSTLHHMASHCNIPQHTALHCNTLNHNVWPLSSRPRVCFSLSHWITRYLFFSLSLSFFLVVMLPLFTPSLRPQCLSPRFTPPLLQTAQFFSSICSRASSILPVK